jgi:hypothetical protein
VREQHLRHGEPCGCEPALPGLHQARLADGGAGLFLGNVLGRRRSSLSAPMPRPTAPGGHHDHLNVPWPGGRRAPRDGGDARGVELADTRCEHAGAEFDDDAPGLTRRGGGVHGAMVETGFVTSDMRVRAHGLRRKRMPRCDRAALARDAGCLSGSGRGIRRPCAAPG